MKNLLNKLDELEDGSFSRKLTKAEKWAMDGRYYRDGAYRRIRPINAAAMVGKHANAVTRKYISYLPPHHHSTGGVLGYLGIEVIARDGCLIDADGSRYCWRRHYRAVQYYVNEQGIITKNPWYKPYRCHTRNRTDPHHIRIRKHAEAASKKRKEDREKKRAAKVKFDEVLTWVFDDSRRHEIIEEIRKKKAQEEAEKWWKRFKDLNK